jgi:hypothetical protein
VNWLTHASNARPSDASLALGATEAVITAFGTTLRRTETGRPDRCPRCRSYAVVPDHEEDGPPAGLCESCGARGVLVAQDAVPESSSSEEP